MREQVAYCACRPARCSRSARRKFQGGCGLLSCQNAAWKHAPLDLVDDFAGILEAEAGKTRLKLSEFFSLLFWVF